MKTGPLDELSVGAASPNKHDIRLITERLNPVSTVPPLTVLDIFCQTFILLDLVIYVFSLPTFWTMSWKGVNVCGDKDWDREAQSLAVTHDSRVYGELTEVLPELDQKTFEFPQRK